VYIPKINRSLNVDIFPKKKKCYFVGFIAGSRPGRNTCNNLLNINSWLVLVFSGLKESNWHFNVVYGEVDGGASGNSFIKLLRRRLTFSFAGESDGGSSVVLSAN